jgi:hypothetical protein
MANSLSLTYLLMIASTYNQPWTTSKNHQNPKHLQKLQPELISLVFLLDPLLLLPMSTLPNCSLTRFNNDLSTSQIHNLKTQANHKHNYFDHSQSHPLHIALQLISSTMLTRTNLPNLHHWHSTSTVPIMASCHTSQIP